MSTPAKLLVSACLLGRPVRYDGRAKTFDDAALSQWQSEGRVVSVCPELLGGFPTPRPPAEITAEIAGARGGYAVLKGEACIVETGGKDVTSGFVEGAEATLRTALEHDCTFALLTDGSPSCGSSFIYDGSFTGNRLAGAGVAAALLRQNGIGVFAPEQFADLAAAMDNHASS